MFIGKSDGSCTSKNKFSGIWYRAISDKKGFYELNSEESYKRESHNN